MTRPPSRRNRDVADRLHSAAIHLLRSLRKVDSETGLTAPRLSVLSVLVFGGPRNLGSLAAIEQVRPPTMTRLVAALEQDGFVKRDPDPADARVSIIRATAKGEKLMWRGRERRVADLAARLDGMRKEELDDLEHAAVLMSRVASRI